MAPRPNYEERLETTEVQTSSCKDDDYLVAAPEVLEKEAEKVQPLSTLNIRWHMYAVGAHHHIWAFYGIYLAFTAAKWQTIVFTFFVDMLGMIGVTAGAHRLWTHRSYKATLPLKIFLASLFSLLLQHTLYEWCQDHRVHHKYVDTDADPHNSRRGFWYSHILWIAFDKTDAFKKKAKDMDMSDLDADPVVQFHANYYMLLSLIIGQVLPTLIPMYFWNESFLCAYAVAELRIVLTFHQTFAVNSFAHMWGYKPYDKNILPVENPLVSFFASGEGFHNYHHVFPWDYAVSEFGTRLNVSTAFINLMAWLGLAYDLKSASKPMIKARKLRTGDKSLGKVKRDDELRNGLTLSVAKED